MGKVIDLTGQPYAGGIIIRRGENNDKGQVQWVCESFYKGQRTEYLVNGPHFRLRLKQKAIQERVDNRRKNETSDPNESQW